ncbi:putative immunity protein [Spirosoma koreense]
MILPKERDPRFITLRRGGTLTDSTHQLLALWAATCAEHVLHLFEQANAEDKRPRQAIELARAWTKGEIPMKQAHKAAFAANAAARGMPDAARFAALAAGQAVAVAHVAAHELGAAAYAIRAVRESVDEQAKDAMAQRECQWQRDQLPATIRELVLDDQIVRNHLCWSVFSC